jgi:hypothetical protein
MAKPMNTLLLRPIKSANLPAKGLERPAATENKKMMLPLTSLPPKPLMKPFISGKIRLKLSMKKNMLALSNQKSREYLLSMGAKVVKPNQLLFVIMV